MTAPVIQNFSPAGPAAPLAAASVSFEVEDAETDTLGAGLVFVSVELPNRTELAFEVGAFVAPYTGTAVVVGDVLTITLFRGGGWGPEAFEVKVIAFDQVVILGVASDSVSYNAATVDTWPPDMQPFTAGAAP